MTDNMNAGNDRSSEDMIEDADTTVARKVETASTVAGQIAHDFDNLLTPLFAYPDLIRRDLPEKCRGRELLDIMEKTAHDMAKITQQLLALSKRGHHKMAPFNINEIAQRVAVMLHDTAAERNIDIQTNLAGDLLLISGASEQMLRVVQNLCQNAMDAMDGGGRIEIATRNLYMDRPGETPCKLDISEYVELKVSDNGSGIPADVIEKMFDPFFTTRKLAKSRGSGLGLSVVRGIVDDHKGLVTVDSAVGKGTTFALYFPICREESAGSEGPKLEKGGTVPCKANSILVVDDESEIRRLFHMILSSAFPKADIETAGNGAEAVVAFRGKHHAVIVMDLRMPVLNGEEAFAEIRDYCKAKGWELPRVVFCTGFAPPDVVKKLAAGGDGHSILAKPVSRDALVTAAGAHLSDAI
ncbi:MAG: ATP-binding protein [bacterium]